MKGLISLDRDSFVWPRHLDLADTSLVSRVCNGDEALILSTNQATLIEQINSFLGLQTSEFYEGRGPTRFLGMVSRVVLAYHVYLGV